MVKSSSEARVPGGIWSDNDTFGVPGRLWITRLWRVVCCGAMIIKALGELGGDGLVWKYLRIRVNLLRDEEHQNS